MIKKIRHAIFETNSSSTHSICISEKPIEKLNMPKELHFKFGEFGWEFNEFNDVDAKASYLYTALYNLGRIGYLKQIKDILGKNNIKVTFEEKKKNGYCGYVDHEKYLDDFINAIIEDENTLMSFLFDGESFVITANDNDEYDITINVNYPHKEFYKGN